MASPGRTSKILVAIAGGVLGLTILAIALLALFLPSDAIRAYAVQEAATYLDRPVDIGDVGLALLPHIGAEVTDVSIGNNPALADEPLVVIDRVVISVGIWRLITGGEVHVSEITVEHPRVAFVVGADGSSSLEGLLKEIDADATPQTATSTTMPIGIQLDHFNVVGGSVFYDDRQAGTTVQIASIDQTLGVTVDAAANNISATGQLSLTGVEATFAEDGTGPFDVSLDHEVFVSLAADTTTFDLALQVAGVPLTMHGTIGVTPESIAVRGLAIRSGPVSIDAGVQLAGLQMEHPQLAHADVSGTLRLDEIGDIVVLPDNTTVGGTISFQLAASGPLHEPVRMSVNGGISLENVHASMPDLPVPVKRLDGSVEIAPTRISVDDMGLWIGSSELHLHEASVTDYLGLIADPTGGRTPRVRFTLRGPLLNLDELMIESPPYADDDVVIPAAGIPPMLLDGTIHIARIMYAEAAFADLRATTTGRDRRVDVDGTTNAFEGTVAFGGWLDLSEPDHARYAGRWDVESVQANAMVETFTDYDDRFHGAAFTSGVVNGTGNTYGDVIQNLTMRTNFRAGNGHLNNWDLVQRTSVQVAQGIDRVRPGLGSRTVERMGLNHSRFPYGQLDGGASLTNEVLNLNNIGVTASDQDWRIEGTIDSAFDTVSTLDLNARLTFSEEITRELATAAAGAINLATPVTGEEIARQLKPANRLRILLPIRGTSVDPHVGLPDLMVPFRKAAESAIRARAQQLKQQADEEVREQATEAVGDAKRRLRGLLDR